MLVNDVDSKLLALTQIAAFLLRNLPEIAPNIVVLFFNNETAHQANHISQAISRYQQRIWNYDLRPKLTDTIRECVLVVNFVNLITNRYIKFGCDKREIKVIMVNTVVPSLYTSPNDLAVQVIRNLLLFTTWNPRFMKGRFNQSIEEAELMMSYPWSAFLRQVRKLPVEERLYAIDTIPEDSDGVATNEISTTTLGIQNAVRFVSGFRIGIYKILAERLSSKQLSYYSYPIRVDVKFTQLQPIRYRDERLSLRYLQKEQFRDFRVSFKVRHRIQSFTNVQPERYMILAPRVVVNGSTSSNLVLHQLLTKCLIVVGLFLIAAIFALLRYFFQSAFSNSTTDGTYSVYLFIDTFARSLGMSAGEYIAKTTSERQLLVVVGFFGILFGGIFSGVLYEQYFDREPVKFLYNTFDDICRANVNLVIPYYEIIDIFIDVIRTLSKNCTPQVYSIMNPNKTVAVIYNMDLISDIDYMSRNYMVLGETFLSKPGTIYVTDTFLERPIREVIQRCVENGIWSGLWSIAVHLQNFDRFRGQTAQYENIGPTMSDTQYAFWILIMGLVCATIIFGGELLAAKLQNCGCRNDD